MTAPILTAKLCISSAHPDLFLRPRLIDILNFGFPRKLTLIFALAGFGKTTLVSEWIQTLKGQIPAIAPAWLSLDEGDNDVSQFLVFFISALQSIDADLAQEVLGAIQSSQPPPIEGILFSLINQIAAFLGRILFVLDDYHLINSPSVHNALGFIHEYLPPQKHIVMATREDPLLP